MNITINIIGPPGIDHSLEKQIPTGVENISWVYNQKGVFDALVVLQSSDGYDLSNIRFRKGNSLLIIREPPEYLRCKPDFANQFDKVISPNHTFRGENVTYSQFGQIWRDSNSYESLIVARPPKKTGVISTVTSGKAYTDGQRKRVSLCISLSKSRTDFDWYGKGVREIARKEDAINPYKYSLVMENGCYEDYWTEKLTDAIIGYSFPIYIGASNLSHYISPDAFMQFDSYDSHVISESLNKLLASDHYETALPRLIEARRKIIEQYNLMVVLEKWAGSLSQSNNYSEIDSRCFSNLARKGLRKLTQKIIRKIYHARQRYQSDYFPEPGG